MGEVQWIKFYIDMFDKRKIKKLRRLPAGNDLLLIWVMLLAMAGKCNAGGHIYITPTVPFQEEDLADELDFDVNTIKFALQAFSELGMIDLSDDGFIYISNWEKYQSTDRLAEIREYNRLAQQRSRARRKELQSVNDMSMTSQRCQDIEEDIEREEDEEKEFHSFNHSDTSENEKALEEYVQGELEKRGYSGEEADKYEKHLRESLKLKYIGGTLGQGVVFMSDAQFDDLCEKLGIDEFDKYMSIVADCEKKGKRYRKKTHYQAILDMAAKDRKIK